MVKLIVYSWSELYRLPWLEKKHYHCEWTQDSSSLPLLKLFSFEVFLPDGCFIVLFVLIFNFLVCLVLNFLSICFCVKQFMLHCMLELCYIN